MQWSPVSEHRFRLGEGPFWDGTQHALYWVDIAGRLACRYVAGRFQQWHLPEPVSAFIPTERGDALVTLASGVYRLDTDSPKVALQRFCVADPTPGNRANEARCDPHGRLWVGSMQNNLDVSGGDLPLTRRSGVLARIDAEGRVTQLLEGQGIVNTLLWPFRADELLCADTLDEVIYRYPLHDDGSLGPRTVWAAQHERGSPDGSAMDAEGYVWNARWGGSCLLRFAPDGCLDRVVELPVSHPTSCVFGGPGLSTLYVTSAAPADAHGRFDGAVLQADIGVSGQACRRFAG